MPVNHGTNLGAVHGLIAKAQAELELAREAEVGTCTYRHHRDMAEIAATIAHAAATAVNGAILHEQLEAIKTINLIVVHPEEKIDGKD